MTSLWQGLRGLGPARLAALAGVGLATLGLLLYLVTRMAADAPMALLYNDLDLRDAAAMSDLLDKAHIPHEAASGGAALMVPRAMVAQARLSLARAGLPSGGSIGYEIFDRGDNLTASEFQQDINQTRALEGELGRSIAMIRGVRGVRVHLVLARHEPFTQTQQDAQASVLLTMSGAARMDRDGVQAVLNLVAAAVPGLRAQNIAIVDDRGELLARAGQPSDGAEGASEDELKRATETRLAHQVEEMLERSVGVGHVRVQAAVDMDFDQTRETQEKYDPDGQVARSTQSITDTSKNTEKEAAVTVQNNLPNPDGGASGASGSQSQRQEETTNYEIAKTTRTIVHDQPRIRRISLAVMVDGVTDPAPVPAKATKGDAASLPAWHERSAEELGRIASLARGVIGYDESRGDKVEIVSMRFTEPADALVGAPSGLLAGLLDRTDFAHLAEVALLAVVALIIALTVLRPAALRLTQNGGGGAEAQVLSGPGMQARLPAPDAPAGLLTDESMIDLGQVEGQIKASSVRRIGELVDKHPHASLAILRGWMASEAG